MPASGGRLSRNISPRRRRSGVSASSTSIVRLDPGARSMASRARAKSTALRHCQDTFSRERIQ